MCDMCESDGPKYKSLPGTSERLKELNQKEQDDILKYGHQVRFVFPGPEDEPDGHTFWYSVGRCVFDKAEFLVTGPLPAKVGHYIVNEVARMVDAGEIELEDGVEVPPDTLLAGYPCRIVRCDPEAGEMFGAIRLAGDDLIAYQVVWPDRNGHFPDSPDYDKRFAQPIFALT